MIETSDYWIYDDIVIIKPYFNNLFDNYIDLFYKYDKLIFSNYMSVKTCLQKEIFLNKKLNFSDSHEPIHNSIFNDKVILPHNLTYLTFGNCFNHAVILPPLLTNLMFGYNFNRAVNLPPLLIYLIFGYNFNQEVILPLLLTHLIFGWEFNHKVILPQLLTHLTFNHNFNQVVNLPPLLTHLKFGYKFNQIVNLPHLLVHLTFGRIFNRVINLPMNLTYIKLNCNNKYLISNLNNEIEELELDYNFDLNLNNLPNNIKKISFHTCSQFNHELNYLPKSLKYLKLNSLYNKKILNIPPKLFLIICSKKYKFINDFDDECEIKYLL